MFFSKVSLCVWAVLFSTAIFAETVKFNTASQELPYTRQVYPPIPNGFEPDTDPLLTQDNDPIVEFAGPQGSVNIVTPPPIVSTLQAKGPMISNNLWDRVRRGFKMQHYQTSEVEQFERWYVSHGDHFYRMSQRAGRYLHFIMDEVERRNMPSELALLPVVESGFNPNALSRSGAAGIWQFIPSTGKNYGLQQNWWHDERRNVVEATYGALDYLQRLYGMFGDWELALAAYNWGEGAVSRAQQKNMAAGLPTDYLSLTLPDETRNYVPKLLAVSRIIYNPEVYGLRLADIPDRPYFAKVPLDQHIDKEIAAELAEISIEEFGLLNAASDRPVILKNNNDYLLLPVDKVAIFQQNLANYDKPLVNWQAYRPEKKERIEQIAKRLGVSVNKIKEANGLSSRAMVHSSQTLLVPTDAEEVDESQEDLETFNMHLPSSHVAVAEKNKKEKEKEKKKTKVVKHKIRRGDTLYELARKYDVSVKEIRALNDKKMLKKLQPGDEVIIKK